MMGKGPAAQEPGCCCRGRIDSGPMSEQEICSKGTFCIWPHFGPTLVTLVLKIKFLRPKEMAVSSVSKTMVHAVHTAQAVQSEEVTMLLAVSNRKTSTGSNNTATSYFT